MRGLAHAGLFSLWIGGQPVPAGRPRVTRWGTYYPKTYKDWIKNSEPFVNALENIPSDKPIALLVEVVRQKAKTSKLSLPIGDVDNYAKGPMDLITKAGKVWKDDKQVVSLTTVKRFAEPDEEPGFKLWWCELNDTDAATREGD